MLPTLEPWWKIQNFLSDLYSMGVIIAYKMLQYGIEKREVAIVGRLTKFSCASFVSSHTLWYTGEWFLIHRGSSHVTPYACRGNFGPLTFSPEFMIIWLLEYAILAQLNSYDGRSRTVHHGPKLHVREVYDHVASDHFEFGRNHASVYSVILFIVRHEFISVGMYPCWSNQLLYW